MLYKLLGMIVWRIGKLMLRRKFGSKKAPPAVFAGGLLALVVGAALLLRGRN
jgi:hypothetical protein